MNGPKVLGADRAAVGSNGPRGAVGGEAVVAVDCADELRIGFSNRAGTPGGPITLDGAEPLKPAEWEQISPGLYSTSR